ncbi:hypothetical protein N5C60_01365 [Pseudomonas mosselii]|uniref:hypothetical protein n=1 Tax=Pseudomonas mosselii TaxID=78327 RepID=UPI00244A0138|nr:hypothetical protein [Pseudomonas mosselii]MDH1143258.1 hypothetical protein [Pseudomonas mosselii]
MIVQVLDGLLLVDGEHRVAGSAVAGDLDGLEGKRDRWMVSKARRALNCVYTAAANGDTFVVMHGFADRALEKFFYPWSAAIESAILAIVNLSAGAAPVESFDLNFHGCLQAGAALAGEALSLNRGRRWRAAPGSYSCWYASPLTKQGEW